MNIAINDLAETVREELEAYAGAVAGDVKDAVKDVAKECRKSIMDRARQLFRTHSVKSYAKSWKAKTVEENSAGVRIVIYSTKYQIAHLLEHGHKVVVKGRVYGQTQPRPHIAPAEREAETKLNKAVKIAVRRDK